MTDLHNQLEESLELEGLREALQQIAQWCEAYPVDMFPEPDLGAVKIALGDQSNQIDRMHASWARHLTEGREALEPKP